MFLIHEKLLCLSIATCVRHGPTHILECQIPAPAVPFSCVYNAKILRQRAAFLK